MFLYKILENPILIQIAFLFFWFAILILYSNILNKKIKKDSIRFYLLLLFLFLSIVAFIRIYSNFLPFTPDSIAYLDKQYRPDFFGPNFYEGFINIINIFFGDNVQILILINIIFYCLAIMELILLVSNYTNKNFSIFFICIDGSVQSSVPWIHIEISVPIPTSTLPVILWWSSLVGTVVGVALGSIVGLGVGVDPEGGVDVGEGVGVDCPNIATVQNNGWFVLEVFLP